MGVILGAEVYAAQIRAALSARHRVHLRYYVPGRDKATGRRRQNRRSVAIKPYQDPVSAPMARRDDVG